jgi:uncharacterized membrane protein YkoI
MYSLRLAAAVGLALVSLAPAQAAEPARCLSGEQQRAAIAEGTAVPLAAALQTARRKMPGELVRARLCHEPGRMVYKLTLLARDGKVRRATIDAASGTLVGELGEPPEGQP